MSNKTAMIFYGGFLCKAGGAFMHAAVFERELRKLGWNVTVITLDSLPIWCRYLPHLVEKLVNHYRKPLGFIYKGYATRALYKYFYNKKVDIRIFEDVYIGWNSKIPSISILHAVWSDNLQSFTLNSHHQERLIALEAECINRIKHAVVTVSRPYSDYLKEIHFKSYNIRELDVVELGLNQYKVTKNKNIDRDIKSIVYAGSLEARKNVFFLLEVYKKIVTIDTSYKLTIIGDGPDMSKLKDFAKNNGLFVSFLGKLTHDEVLSELNRHGVYLHTSTKESFSFSLLEAKLAGLKTCAYAGLQVPREFIDVEIKSFNVDEWCNGVLNDSCKPNEFNHENYTAKKMITNTLKLI